jgi:hypothetical protein
MSFWEGIFYGFAIGVFGYLFVSTLIKIALKHKSQDEVVVYLTEIYQNQTSKDIVVVEGNTMVWDEKKQAYKRRERESHVVYYYDKIEEGLEVYGED